MTQTCFDDIPLMSMSGRVADSIPRQYVKFYNVHIRIHSNTMRVGESPYLGGTVYIYDRFGIQWAETTSLPNYIPPGH